MFYTLYNLITTFRIVKIKMKIDLPIEAVERYILLCIIYYYGPEVDEFARHVILPNVK